MDHAAFYKQSHPSTTPQGYGKIPKEQHQHHSAPPLRPPGPPIRVNLKSDCLECQVKLKKKLQKISGVKDVDIVPEQGGIVTVSGSIDSKVLMGVIGNNYKKAKLLCPFDQNEPSKNNACKNSYCSEDESDDGKDDPAHNFAVNNNREDGADPSEPEKEISEPKKEKKTKTKTCGILRCFGKESNPKPMPPPPPRPPTSAPARPPFMGIPANGFFPGQPRPVFRPGMPWMPPHVPPPPYGYPGRPPLPMSTGFPFPRSPPRSNPMVHYTSFSDNYRYPCQ